MPRNNCPVCDSANTEAFLHRRGVPVHQNMLFDSAHAAQSIARGDLEMRACADCGFVFNAAFDPQLVDYGPAYENSQDCSPAFHAHLDSLVNRIVVEREIRTGTIVEVGCGKGTFLRRLISHPLNTSNAVGFDPSYIDKDDTIGVRAKFYREFYGPATAVPADAVVCRHVIEHIPEPLSLLRTVRVGVGSSGRTQVFFETPCVEWILRNRVPWDFFYEHCSLFTAASLSLALERAGFRVSEVRHVFGGQYLWAEASSDSPLPRTINAETVALARLFAAEERERIRVWDTLLTRGQNRGSVYAWGAGAKGVTFCNLADPGCTRIAGVVDVNPAKQGKYLPGTGHAIVTPEAAKNAAIP